MKRDILIFVLFLFLVGCQKDSTTPETANYSASFSKVWNDYDLNYSYFVHKNINWADIKNTYEPMIEEEVTYAFFINEVLAPMLIKLTDVHVRLIDKYGNSITLFNPKRNVNYNYSPAIDSKYFTNIKTTSYGTITRGDVGDSLFYIRIINWWDSDYTKDDIDEFLHFFDTNPEVLNSYKGLIIDVRPNGGGQELLASRVAGRFTNTQNLYGFRKERNGPNHNDFTVLQPVYFRPSGYWHYTKPIALLIGELCMSSNESFILMMSTLSHVTTIGDTTGGASANPKFFSLEDGTTYSISSWVAYKPDATILEDIGIFPDIAIDASESILNDRDMVLEKAIEILQ